MGKKHKSQSKADATVSAEPSTSGPSIFAGGQDAVDPLLASLFEKSSGPVKAPQFLSGQSTISRTDEVSSAQPRGKAEAQNGVALEDGETSLDSGKEEESSASDDDAVMEDAEEDVSIDGHKGTEATELAKESTEPEKPRKRKRTAEDDVEGAYMKRIAKEQAKEEEKQLQEKKKRRKIVEKDYSRDDAAGSGSDGEAEASSSEDEALPVHETISGEKDTESRDASVRTVFVGNVSTDAIKSKSAKKQLLAHLASFFATLPESSVPHKVESIRFRSTAFSSTAVPKRASFAKRELMDSTTRSTNAYVVYSTETAARKASLALNGSVVLDRHLRVDSVSHPAPVDHKRCVFVGNLDFVDEEPSNPDEDDKKKKKKPSVPADVEEGLWRTFNQHTRAGIKSTKGPVESVRVIRDASTRVSKGFAYVQFHNENSVEAALLLDGQKFPPLLPRKLRVVRAKRIAKQPAKGSGNPNKQPLGTSKEASLQGRASRLLGRAGAARLRASKSDSSTPLVFEGHRATADKSGIALRTKSRGAQGKVKAKGKPKTRSTRRAAAYRAVGGKPMGKMKASKQK